MSHNTKTRCSRLPLNVLCPQSLIAPEVEIDNAGEPAWLGTATHKVQAHAIENKLARPCQEQIARQATAHKVDAKDLQVVAAQLWTLWLAAREWFPEPVVESSMEWESDGIRLTGTADVVAVDRGRDELLIADHKTGWLETDATAQLLGYAFLGLKVHAVSSVRIATLRPRHGYTQWAEYSRDEVLAWWETFVSSLENPRYNPGRHCAHCPRLRECPAARTEMAHAIQLLDNFAIGEALEIVQLVEVYNAIKLVRPQVDKAWEWIKSLVEAAGGSISLGDGNELALDVTQQREILAGPGWNLLQQAAGDRLAECLKVGKTRLEEIVKENAPRGQKGKAVKALMDDLEQANAIAVKPIERLTLRAIQTEAAIEDNQHEHANS